MARHFPHVASKPLAPHHTRFWDWIVALRPNLYVPAHILIIARGGGKSTTVELGVAYVATTLARRFVLIVSETQDQANARIGAIRTLLERLGEKPATTAIGTVKSWRANQIRTERGFNVAGIGLDSAMRGVKLDEFRPDWIVLDDLDGLGDTPATTAKKELALTATILAAGSDDCVVSGTQNLILEDGLFARVAARRSDYLADATVDGPIPAVHGLRTEIVEQEDGKRLYKIVAGVATWTGQSIGKCEELIRKIGLRAFDRECQHNVKGAQGWVFDPDQIKAEDSTGVLFTSVAWGMDLAGTENGGDWSVFVLFARDTRGRTWILDVRRFQKEPNGVVREVVEFGRKWLGTYPKMRVGVLRDPSWTGKLVLGHLMERLEEAGFERENLSPVAPHGRGNKATRATNFAEDVNAGRVVCEANLASKQAFEDYKSVLRNFREDDSHLYDDDVDASSDAESLLWREPGTDPSQTDAPTPNRYAQPVRRH